MVIETIAIILAVSLIAAIATWKHILAWAQDTFFPWLKKHLPTLEQSVRDAFNWFDQNIATPIRRTIKEAWKKLRTRLLKVLVKFERRSSNRWVKLWTAYLIKSLETKTVLKQEVTEEISWDEVPDEVRESSLRWGTDKEINVTDIRDKQVMEEVY